jgi:two-component system chemotaxis sensor kinase CheA
MGAEAELQQRLRALFAEELDDGLQLLGPGLLSLEEQAGHASGAELVRELFRAAHSLKGAAHAAAVPEAVAICDRLETVFAAVRDGERVPDAALVTQLLAETDTLSSLASRLHDTAAPVSSVPSGRAPVARPDPRTGSAATSEPAPVPAQPSGSLRVTADRVDEVLRQAGEGLVASRRLHAVVEQATRAAEEVETARGRLRSALHRERSDAVPAGLDTLLDDAARAVTALARTVEATDRTLHHASSGVADAVQRLRTEPFGAACSSLDRVVRDIAVSTGKSARLTVVGSDVDVDRDVITALRDPLLHLVRNAVDHGLEAPDVRSAAGKPATGSVEVIAALEGSLLHVTVRDDGAGIDTARLRDAAAGRGLPLPDDDAELPFVAGLSSRDDVTDVSGRGIGLDAVRARLEQLGGSVQMTSQAGTGTGVQLTCPVTLAVLRVLLVRAGGQVVALPTSSVERVSQVDRQELREVEGQVLLTLGRRSVRAVSLAEALGFSVDPAVGDVDPLGVVVPRGGDAVLVTDGLLDELEVAVQPVPVRLAGAAGVLGITVSAGGLPAVVVNPVAVGRSSSPFAVRTAPAPQTAAVRILLAEDTVTTRALERSILEAAGYSVAVAVDGADAWEQLQADGADLVVSDVDMPRMSGIDLCRRIRSSPQLRELPVVLVTSLDSSEDRKRGLEAGADAYVAKSEFQQGTLLDAIARLL